MRTETTAGTEHLTLDNGGTRPVDCCGIKTDCNRRILFHSTYLAATIHITSSLFKFSVLDCSHCAVTDNDMR